MWKEDDEGKKQSEVEFIKCSGIRKSKNEFS